MQIDEAHAFQLLKPAMYKILRAMLGKTKVLFIDEISLVSALLFAQTSANIQMALGSQKPFGGLSVVLFGDLLQLSPVNGNPIYEEVSERFSIARITRAPCVTYRLWDLFKMFRLFENVRTDDEAEARMLMEVREERISEETENFFKRHFVIRNSTDAGIFDEVDLLRRLYPEKEIAILAVRNIVVNRMNEVKINRMEGVQQIRWTSAYYLYCQRMTDFYVTLVSNAHSDSTISNFQSTLPSTLRFNRPYEVALSSIIYPNSQDLISNNMEADGRYENEFTVVFNNKKVKCKVQNCSFLTPSQLVEILNYTYQKKVKTTTNSMDKEKDLFTYKPLFHSVTIENLKHVTQVELSDR
ncbi:hypothetical protein CAEBREN_17462 [Caenorhabditis brenneri]|uniref:ATP-dependent DNA helicase n=1 Tax=Caenorhabditis brenneri TaxID=135651 RepID=G0PDJ5_CAEBE|nr:hypothetical protein CAEBREN_17462 [Caenorhabditis brenneri]